MGRRAAELERHLAVRKLNTVRRWRGTLAVRTSLPRPAVLRRTNGSAEVR